ncbi:hypothetical protein JW868_02900 [Candidatus Woesearchaeota archaeon]|nr:hypothetical protein [Candidatus Woesearchaeota archaeon]
MDLLMYIPKFIMIVIAFGLFAFTINLYEQDWINTKPAEVEVFANKAYYELATYVDEMGKPQLGVIDLAELKSNPNNLMLDKVINYAWDNYIAANISLVMFKFDPSTGQTTALGETVYYQEQLYKDWYPKTVLEGVGGVTETYKVLPVRFRDQDGLLQGGFMKMSILQLNG